MQKFFKLLKLPFFTKLEILEYSYYRLKTNLFYRCFFKRMGIKNVIYSPLKLSPSCICLGSSVLIYKLARIEGVYNYQKQYFTPEIIIEDGVSIQQNIHMTCASKIQIGRNTAIAANVTITDINHSYEDINYPIELSDLKISDVTIGKDCKIYNNAIILPGTIIGDHCIIGANSVIKGTIPNYSVVAGAPAKIIKQYDLNTNQWIKK